MTTTETFLEAVTSSPYGLQVPPEFTAQFFKDRRAIAAEAASYFDGLKRTRSDAVDDVLHFDGTDIWGQSTLEENYALDQVVRLCGAKNALEIGLFRGQTASTITRALQPQTGRYTGIDISDEALAIVTKVLGAAKLSERVELKLGDSAEIIDRLPAFDFALVDGDHHWPSVVRDVVGIYNKQKAGGVIAMHDIGTAAWGWTMQDPGHLVFRVLPKLVDGHAKIYWLDSMCRETTMKLLSPSATGEDTYFTNVSEALEKARVTTYDTVKGWGGLGFIVKHNAAHQLVLDDVLACAPASVPAPPPSKGRSIFRRVADRIARSIP
jgi:predicted O-methyltransferase YrrM